LWGGGIREGGNGTKSKIQGATQRVCWTSWGGSTRGKKKKKKYEMGGRTNTGGAPFSGKQSYTDKGKSNNGHQSKSIHSKRCATEYRKKKVKVGKEKIVITFGQFLEKLTKELKTEVKIRGKMVQAEGGVME